MAAGAVFEEVQDQGLHLATASVVGARQHHLRDARERVAGRSQTVVGGDPLQQRGDDSAVVVAVVVLVLALETADQGDDTVFLLADPRDGLQVVKVGPDAAVELWKLSASTGWP